MSTTDWIVLNVGNLNQKKIQFHDKIKQLCSSCIFSSFHFKKQFMNNCLSPTLTDTCQKVDQSSMSLSGKIGNGLTAKLKLMRFKHANEECDTSEQFSKH
ncbi:hypothetical protein BLOT_000652 [Blomia tropicalis]|nr:hypothetical protein BLOT_000652 [Blomia tropicalis]